MHPQHLPRFPLTSYTVLHIPANRRLQRRVTELESDLAAARTSARSLEAQLTAASVQRSELGRRAEELEAAAGRDREAAREARSKAEAAEAALEAAEARAGQAEAAAEAERREVERFQGEAAAALAAAEEARSKAVGVEQQMLEMQVGGWGWCRPSCVLCSLLQRSLLSRDKALPAQRPLPHPAARALVPPHRYYCHPARFQPRSPVTPTCCATTRGWRSSCAPRAWRRSGCGRAVRRWRGRRRTRRRGRRRCSSTRGSCRWDVNASGLDGDKRPMACTCCAGGVRQVARGGGQVSGAGALGLVASALPRPGVHGWGPELSAMAHAWACWGSPQRLPG